MGPCEFRNSVVVPNIEDLLADFGNVRCAFNAVASVDALAALVFAWCQSNAPHAVAGIEDDVGYREHLARRDADFGLLRDTAKVQKHARLIRGQPKLTEAAQVKPKSLGFGEARWGEARFGSPTQVVVETNSGESRAVEALLTNALTMLDQEILRCGIPP